MGMLKGLRGAVSVPTGYGAAPRSKKYVSRMIHGFFITINSMILYFKHIIHIDDLPLNGHPSSVPMSDGYNECKCGFKNIILGIIIYFKIVFSSHLNIYSRSVL